MSKEKKSYSRDDLIAQLAKLKADQELAVGQLNRINGAITFVEMLLNPPTEAKQEPVVHQARKVQKIVEPIK